MALLRLRRVKESFLPPQYSGQSLLRRLLSPDLTWNDLRWTAHISALLASNRALYQFLLSDGAASLYHYPLHYQVPFLMVMGQQDWTTPLPLAQQYFTHVCAPRKRFILLQGAGHLPFLAQPQAFASALDGALRELLSNP